MKASERRWESGFRGASRNTSNVASVANVALDGCGFGNVREVGDDSFLGHGDDGINGDVS